MLVITVVPSSFFLQNLECYTEFPTSAASHLPWIHLKFVLRLPIKSDDLVFFQTIFLCEVVDRGRPELLKVQLYLNGQNTLFFLDDEVYLLLVFRPPVID